MENSDLLEQVVAKLERVIAQNDMIIRQNVELLLAISELTEVQGNGRDHENGARAVASASSSSSLEDT